MASAGNDGDGIIQEDSLGPWPSPMDNGYVFVQFGRHFREVAPMFLNKCGKRFTGSGCALKNGSVLYNAVKMFDAELKCGKWADDNKGNLEDLPAVFQNFSRIKEELTNVLKETLKAMPGETLPLLLVRVASAFLCTICVGLCKFRHVPDGALTLLSVRLLWPGPRRARGTVSKREKRAR